MSASPQKTLTLIGGGKMGQAMARGWLADLSATGLEHVAFVDPKPSQDLEDLAANENASLNSLEPQPVGVLLLAVKPQVFGLVADQIKQWVGDETLVVSVMAGVTIEGIQNTIGARKVIRAMPNTPGAVGAGVTAFAPSSACGETDAQLVSTLLKPLGHVEGPLEEVLIDAVTAVSGSGPAYAFLLVEAMANAGTKLGLPPEMSQRLARQTVIGAGMLMDQDPTSAEDLRKSVTSPNGTTQAALEVMMEADGIPDVVENALKAARDKSIELSKNS